MKTRDWLLPGVSVLLLGIGIVAYPPLHLSIQSAVREKQGLDRTLSPHASTEQARAPVDETTKPNQVYQQVNPAVVTIYGETGSGSGMVLRSNGVILTNKHLVNNAAHVMVKTATGDTYDGTVVDFDLQYDLALIRLTADNLRLPTVKLANAVKITSGDRVYAIGHPNGKPGTLTTGTFTRLTPHGSLQTSAGLLNPGNSGGPLLNAQGEVIGVNKGLLSDRSGLATPLVAAKALLQRYETVNKTQ